MQLQATRSTRRIFNFSLAGIAEAAELNLREVLMSQKRVPQKAASDLSITPAITACDGNQPVEVISAPIIRKRASPMSISSFPEAHLISFYSLFLSGVLSLFFGMGVGR